MRCAGLGVVVGLMVRPLFGLPQHRIGTVIPEEWEDGRLGSEGWVQVFEVG